MPQTNQWCYLTHSSHTAIWLQRHLNLLLHMKKEWAITYPCLIPSQGLVYSQDDDSLLKFIIQTMDSYKKGYNWLLSPLEGKNHIIVQWIFEWTKFFIYFTDWKSPEKWISYRKYTCEVYPSCFSSPSDTEAPLFSLCCNCPLKTCIVLYKNHQTNCYPITNLHYNEVTLYTTTFSLKIM